MTLPQRKSNRLPTFSYSTPGAYFITVCTHEKRHLLSHIVGGGALDAPHAQLTHIGRIVRNNILSANRMPGVSVDKFVIMPNHIHTIVFVDKPCGPSKEETPANAQIPRFVSALKRFCHKDLGFTIFQRSYHDHVIRNQQDYLKIWQYIDNNPARWKEDCFFLTTHLFSGSSKAPTPTVLLWR